MVEAQTKSNKIDWSFLTSPEFLNSFSEILDAIAWPLALFFVVLLMKSTLHQIALKLCDRIKKVGRDGVEFNGLNQLAQSKEDSETKKKLLDVTFKDTPIITHYMNLYANQFEEGIVESGLNREDFLKSKAVEGFIAWGFERIYNNIFGSQIQALQYLISNEGQVSEDALKVFYNQAKKNFPEFYDNYTYKNWFDFLKTNNLINLEEDLVKATIETEAFSTYLSHHNLYVNKVF